MVKNICIIHFRVGKSDGVSLEIEKRLRILKKYPAKITLIAGNKHSQFPTYKLNYLNLNNRKTVFILTNLFREANLFPSVVKLWFDNLEKRLYWKFRKIFEKEKFDFLVVHNLLSLPIILPASTALLKVLDEFKIPTLSVNHDFWFNRKYLSDSPYQFVKEEIKSFPPKRDYIIHQVINSLDQKEIWQRNKIKAEKISDYVDFELVGKDEFNQDFLEHFGIDKNDLLVLQATRIVPRKAIENSLYFVAELEKKLRKKVALFFPNFPELDFYGYYKRLQKLAKKMKVKAIWAHKQISLERKIKNGKKIYSFWDPYLFADLVTYPSYQEGFGNQLLEAFFYKKPIVLFEYPVFKTDIKKEGYQCISLGDKIQKKNGWQLVPGTKIKNAVKETIAILTNPKLYQKITQKNFEIAHKNHSLNLLEMNLQKNIFQSQEKIIPPKI